MFYEGEGQDAPTRTAYQVIVDSGEPGLLRYLARQAGVPAFSFEPERSDVHRELLLSFSPVQVQMFLLLRRVRHFAADRRVPWEQVRGLTEAHIYDAFGPNAALDWPIRSFADLEGAFARTWPERSMRDMPRNWFNPTLASTETQSVFLNDVNTAESNFRNRHFYRRLAAALLAGHRVFAAVGASHVPILAPALECLDAPLSTAPSPA